MTDRGRLEERRTIAQRDLEELADQVEAGEIDPETAAALRANYQAELDEVTMQLGDLEPPTSKRDGRPSVDSSVPEAGQTRSNRRAVVGSVVVIAALSVAIFLAAGNLDPEPGTTAPQASEPGGLGVDPGSVTNEQLEAVVAENPDINAMRLALADRYFDEENYGRALEHYLFIAENNPTPSEEGRSLARIGWMAYITGQPEAAAQYLQISLTADPTNDETKLFLGFVLLYGLDDAEGAIPWLEEVAQVRNLPAGILAQVEMALAEARGGGGG